MNNLCADISYRSLNKHGEQLCGDMVQLVKDNDDTILVLADGLGSGVKANILSTLTSKIISTMIANKMSVEDCVSTIVSTLPVCKVRQVAYSTFTIIQIENNNFAHIFQYDNPKVILLRNGKNFDYPTKTHIISDKKVLESKIKLECNDLFITMSDGAVYAGVGQLLNYGWQRENIVEFLEGHYNEKMSAQSACSLLLDECNALYEDMPGDDTTIAAIKIRERFAVNLMFGPPHNPNDVNKMQAMFFAKQGKHIVCGGTTSNLTAQYLGKGLITSIDYLDSDIPPTAKIEGVDLVTEGVLTINRVMEYAKDYLGENKFNNEWRNKKDGASQIARILFDEATNINFYVGRAVNPAHQNPDLPIRFNIKMQLIEELSQALDKMGKVVNMSYF